jgi:ATP-binding cassette subfamily C protein LapB
MTQFNYINCLKPLLRILGWQGSSRDVFEAVPYDVSEIDLIDLKNIFVDLGYTCYHKSIKLSTLSRSFLPTLFINEDHNIYWVIYEKTERDYLYIDCLTGQKAAISSTKNIKGTRYNFIKDAAPKNRTTSWLKDTINRFKADLKKPILLSNLVAVTTLIPALVLYLMISGKFYDQSSTSTLATLSCCLALMIGIYTLSWTKNKTLSYLSARLSILSNREALYHVLHLNPDDRHNLVSQQEINRLQQIDLLQEKISTLLKHLVTDLPMVIAPLITIWILNVQIAALATGSLLIGMGYLRHKFGKIKSNVNSLDQQDFLYQQFLQDSAIVIEDVRNLSADRLWTDRLKTYLGDYLQAHKKSLTTLAHTLVRFRTIGTGTFLIGLAVLYHLTGLNYSVANLFATAMLVYLIGIHSVQLSYLIGDALQISQLVLSTEQWLQTQSESNEATKLRLAYKGEITIKNLSFTYPGQDRMALQDLNVQINSGDVIAVMGQNASGKSTFIKLLMGLYPPSKGTINFDGIDLNDLNLHHHRQSIGYVSSQIDLFNLSIAQNLRLAQPDITDREIISTLDKLDAMATIDQLPDGIHTILTPDLQKTLPSAFLQKINLARAFVRNSKILILDEPTGNLDMKADAVFKNLIQSLRGEKTIIIVTHRPSIINLADQVLVLNNGIMRLFGPKAQVLKILSGNAA